MNGIKLPHDGQQQLWRSAECQKGLDISQKLQTTSTKGHPKYSEN